MKYLLAVVSALVCVGFASADHHIPAKTCYSCMESSLSDCSMNMMNMFNCSNSSFPNVGSEGCYTFVGWYWSNGTWKSGAVRGCANCSNIDGTKESIKDMSSSMLMWDFNLMFAEITCCNSTNCNNMNLALPPHPSSTVTPSASSTVAVEEKSDTSPTEPESGAYSNFLSSFAFVMTAIVLLFK